MLSPKVRKFGKKYITNKKDLQDHLKNNRSENQKLVWRTNMVYDLHRFTMFSSFSIFSITLNKVSFIQILNWFCLYGAESWSACCFSTCLHLSTICLLGRAIEVMLKLRGSCHLPVALKHPQSLCLSLSTSPAAMRELVHVQGGQMSDIGLYAL